MTFFHILLLEQDITRKGQVDKTMSRLEFKSNSDSEEYKVKVICNNAVYLRELKDHLSSLYYLILWKGYLKEENTWEPTLAVLYLHKLISTFYYDHFDKPIAISPLIDSAPLMARLTMRFIVRLEALSTKQKRDRSAKANGTSKRIKKS